MIEVKKGDIYLADLGKGIGSEQSGIRPVLIVQNNVGNKYSPTTIVVCMSTKTDTKKHLPTHYVVSVTSGVKYRSLVMTEQIRTIDKTRLIKFIGTISKTIIPAIDKKLDISLGIK